MLAERSRIIIIGSGTSWLANTSGEPIITEHSLKIVTVIEINKFFYRPDDFIYGVVRSISQVGEDRV
jgi:glucosamine 6-phosphate synthetase-like amidotransferase/phosphosugar isomerase protein